MLPPLIFKLKASLSGMGVISGLYTRAEREVAREIDLFDAARCTLRGLARRNRTEFCGVHDSFSLSLSLAYSRVSFFTAKTTAVVRQPVAFSRTQHIISVGINDRGPSAGIMRT